MGYDYYLSKNINKRIEDLKLEIGKEKDSMKNKLIKENKIEVNNFYPVQNDLTNLPNYSALIKIPFILKKPYTSKDDGEFHILDEKIFENPIVRDKFTGLPIVRPSTWKGHLRFAAERVDWDEKKKKKIIRRLFGSEKDEEKNKEIMQKGRLNFFTTFFKVDPEKDVITPLKRDTRTPSRGPIPLEVMKPENKGDFYILYMPYPKGKDFDKEQVDNDLKFLADALQLMFYVYGFSAKKSSGFGVIQEEANESEINVKLDLVKKCNFNTLNDLKSKIDELFEEKGEKE